MSNPVQKSVTLADLAKLGITVTDLPKAKANDAGPAITAERSEFQGHKGWSIVKQYNPKFAKRKFVTDREVAVLLKAMGK